MENNEDVIKSNKGNYCIPPLRNSINDQNIDDIAYDDSDKCELLHRKLKIEEEEQTIQHQQRESTIRQWSTKHNIEN